MPFDFPSPATDGQTVTGPHGQLYVYSAATGVWGASGSAAPLAIAYGGTGATTAPAALTALGAAPIASPALTGTPTAPTAAPGTNTTQVATTAFAVAGDALRVAKAGDTMSGALSVNMNGATVQPGLPVAQYYAVAPNNSNTVIALDGYGSNTPYILSRAAAGTIAAPTNLINGQWFGAFICQGYAATGYGGNNTAIHFVAKENWTATAQGSQVEFTSTPNGTNSAVVSLALNGNTATFSGTIQNYIPPTPAQNGSFICGAQLTISSGSLCGNLYYDGSNFRYLAASGAVSCYLNPTASSFNWYSAPSGAAGAIATQSGTMTLDVYGNLTIAGGTAVKPGGGSWASSSMRELKQDIAPYNQGLSAVLALKPVTYRYNEASGYATEATYVGLIHDETAHMPEMHRKATIGGDMESEGREVDALDFSAITFVLINAVKELTAKIEALEKRVNGSARKR